MNSFIEMDERELVSLSGGSNVAYDLGYAAGGIFINNVVRETVVAIKIYAYVMSKVN